jgi:hypothetical protein
LAITDITYTEKKEGPRACSKKNMRRLCHPILENVHNPNEHFESVFRRYKERQLIRCQHCELAFMAPDEIKILIQHHKDNRCATCRVKFFCGGELEKHANQVGHFRKSGFKFNPTSNIVKCCLNAKRKNECTDDENNVIFQPVKKVVAKISHGNVKCEFCSKIMSCKAKLKFHLSKKHDVGAKYQKDSYLFICAICGLEFEDEVHLRAHSAQAKCTVCQVGIRCAVEFVEHRKICELERKIAVKHEIEEEILIIDTSREDIDWVNTWIKQEPMDD